LMDGEPEPGSHPELQQRRAATCPTALQALREIFDHCSQARHTRIHFTARRRAIRHALVGLCGCHANAFQSTVRSASSNSRSVRQTIVRTAHTKDVRASSGETHWTPRDRSIHNQFLIGEWHAREMAPLVARCFPNQNHCRLAVEVARKRATRPPHPPRGVHRVILAPWVKHVRRLE